VGQVVIGRDPELAVIAEFLGGLRDAPAVLVLEGEPGIGKSTLLAAGVAHARASGLRVMSCGPSPAEVRLGYAALGDLMNGVGDDVIDRLPASQARALAAATLREDARASELDQRAVAAGFLQAIERLGREGSVLLAIDDMQWLDASSRQVVQYATRRLAGPVGILASLRVPPTVPSLDLRAPDPERLTRVRLGPLSLAALHDLLADRLGRTFTRPMLVRINNIAEGNPFFALEIARTLHNGAAPEDITLPAGLAGLVDDRIGRLQESIRDVLLVASAAPVASVDLLRRTTSRDDIVTLLERAEAEGIVALDGGRVHFTHPLLARGVYETATPARRRAVHRRLSELVDGGEQRARHLALGSVEPTPQVIAALDTAARAARARAAPTAAAELLELALALGPVADASEDVNRRIQAGAYHLDAGDLGPARTVLEDAFTKAPPGSLRARALNLLGSVCYLDDNVADAVVLLERARREPGIDRWVRIAIARQLVYCLSQVGRFRDALPVAQAALVDAEAHAAAHHEPAVLGTALAEWVIVRFLLGHGLDRAALERALMLEDRDIRMLVPYRPTTIAAHVQMWSGRLDEARAMFSSVLERSRTNGDDIDLDITSYWLVLVTIWQGDLATARRLAADVRQRAALRDTDVAWAFAAALQTTIAAWTGDVDATVAHAEHARSLMTAAGLTAFLQSPVSDLGFLRVSLGDHASAVALLAPLAEACRSMGLGEPLCLPFLPDLVEALVALGRLDEADPWVDWLEERGSTLDRPWARAVGASCRGLLLAARGDVDQAEEALATALAEHDQVGMPRDRARSLLVMGQVQRRQGRRSTARCSLEEALRAFEQIGMPLWSDRARAELARLGLHLGAGDALTPSEARVAELAATGMTNREVAAALFISPKTVEANLSRAYRKLGIRTRAELGRVMAEHGRETPDAP
jgi:ATP/maltotriose-dependent transcriptional regulator MalT